MAVGFVLITAQAGRERAVHDDLQAMQTIVEVVPLLGEFDLIAKLDADDLDALGRTILDIRNVAGVLSTKTLPTANL